MTNPALANLPTWDLSDLYQNPADPAITRDLATARKQAIAFRQQYRGTIKTADASTLLAAIHAYEALEETLGKVLSYAQLYYSADTADAKRGKFYQDCQEDVSAASKETVFFTLEINTIADEHLAQHYAASPALQRYRPWLEGVRQFRPYQLEERLEELLHEKYTSGRAAWNRLYDETMASLRFPLDGQQLTETEILHTLNTSKDRETRARAAACFSQVLQENSNLLTLITNTLAKDKEVEDRWRGFKQPVSSRNLANQVEDDVIAALVDTVRRNYSQLSHRYYALKAKWLGLPHLEFWDRNAPLPTTDDTVLSWQEATDVVLNAYHRFSPKLADVGRKFFHNAWIDAEPRAGKDAGAFAHPVVPSAHPYLLVNYKGKPRDVMTLAHELGHGVHQVLAAKQGYLLADTPLTLAETASVFGEMLTFQALLASTSNPTTRKILLAGKVEDMLNTVVRQIAFHSFEEAVHNQRKNGELPAEALGAIWMETQRASLGDAVRLDDLYQPLWSYIPHFVHTPFYVYAYAFGDCLVNSLYAIYQQAEAGFAEKYLALLEAGGTKRYHELLQPFGLDARNPDFWQQGLTMLAGFIDELEALDSQP